ncbi:hypothetical protein GCM10010210_11510 [Pseudonocardia hydrocarbonoxydans]|uniref:Uncharacterized protein n=1 Tax=Pseudonocardia hydrocarbonoxydans TaxID=76726 RepID=A0A4Y3WTK0_9PSEU|nr:hypothetical protein PHY01_41110 [Pseudonocardia hydrocarbonoxydans]
MWRRLVDRAAGNALFLRQLGRLVASEGADAATTALPLGIRDVLGRRLDRLPGRTVATLARAAVLGREIDVDLLLEVGALRGSQTEDEIVDDLDSGVVAGLLQAGSPGELRFTHALVRDAAYERIPPVRRARLHLDVLDALERRAGGHVFALAHHAALSLRAATADRALPHLLTGARQAQRAGAVAEAAGYWRAALRAHDLGAGSTAQRLEAHRELVRCIAAGGDLVAAGAERAVSIRVAEEIGSPDDVGRAWVWDTPGLWSTRPFTDQHSVVDRISAVLDRVDPADAHLRARLLATRAAEAEPWGLETGLRSAEAALALARRLDDPRLLCQALNVQYLQTFRHSDVTFAARTGREMLDVATAAGLLDHQALAHLVLASDAVGRGDLGSVPEHVRGAVRAGTTGQLPALLLAASLFAATADLVHGHVDRARAAFVDATDRIAASGDPNAALVRIWALTTVEHAAGDTSPLLPQLLDLRARYPRGVLDDQLATALLDAGDEAGARALWPIPAWPRNSTWLSVTALRADLAVRLRDPVEAARCHQDLLPWSGQLVRSLNGVLVHGPVDGFLARTAALLGRADDARRHRTAAGELARRIGAPHWVPA